MMSKQSLLARLPATPVCLALGLILGLCAVADQARAAAPPPRRVVEVNRFLGRWFEAARTPNLRENACVTASMEFARAGERYAVTQTCWRSRGGPQVFRAGLRFEDPRAHAKMEVAFFGGLIRAHYWVLDHDPAYQWVIVATSGGRYVWLLSRAQALPQSARQEAEASLRSLGYDPRRLRFAGP